MKERPQFLVDINILLGVKKNAMTGRGLWTFGYIICGVVCLD